MSSFTSEIHKPWIVANGEKYCLFWNQYLKPLTKNPIEELLLLKQETAISSRMRWVYQNTNTNTTNTAADKQMADMELDMVNF